MDFGMPATADNNSLIRTPRLTGARRLAQSLAIDPDISQMTPFAKAGSQRWLQVTIDRYPQLLNEPLANAIGIPSDSIDWRSPRRDHDFREYRDMEALRRLNVARLPVRTLSAFWPRRGPVWDALGRAKRGDLLFVEAKAHIAEAASPPTQASPDSLRLIRKTLLEVCRVLAPTSEADWSRTFYQYANRLAHLYLIRHINHLPAHLVFVYYLNARDVGGPGTRAEWEAAIKLLRAALGIQANALDPFVHDVFIDVDRIGNVDG